MTQFADHPCELKGYNDLLSITQPHIVRDIHSGYCRAGADIIATNTFTSTSVSMEDYQLQDIAYQVNYAAACKSHVKSQTNGRLRTGCVIVAGSMGPTNRRLLHFPKCERSRVPEHVTFSQLVAAYTTQAEGLIDGGADILLVETVMDTLKL